MCNNACSWIIYWPVCVVVWLCGFCPTLPAGIWFILKVDFFYNLCWKTGNNQLLKTGFSPNTLTSQHADKPLDHKQDLFDVHQVLCLQSAPGVIEIYNIGIQEGSTVFNLWMRASCDYVGVCPSLCILTYSGRRTGWAESGYGKAAEDSHLSTLLQGTCII